MFALQWDQGAQTSKALLKTSSTTTSTWEYELDVINIIDIQIEKKKLFSS